MVLKEAEDDDDVLVTVGVGTIQLRKAQKNIRRHIPPPLLLVYT